MKLVYKDFFFEHFACYFQGCEIIVRQNVFSKEITFLLTDEFAKCLGYESVEKMMLDDNILDGLNEIYKETGVFPITKY